MKKLISIGMIVLLLFVIFKFEIFADGNSIKIDVYYENLSIKVKVNIEETDIDGIFIGALYKDDIIVSTVCVEAEDGVELIFPEGTEGEKVEVFLWQNNTSLKPVSNSVNGNIPETVKVMYCDVSIYKDGEFCEVEDDMGKAVQPFLYNDTIYVPLKTAAKIAEMDLEKNYEENSVYLTTGFNHIMSIDWENGAIITNSGLQFASETRLRTADYINAISSSVKIEIEEGYSYLVYVYAEDKTFLKCLNNNAYTSVSQILEEGYLYKISIKKNDDSNIILSDAKAVTLKQKITLSDVKTETEESVKKINSLLNIPYYRALFSKIICIGDSVTRGMNYNYIVGERNRDYSYPVALSRIANLVCDNYGNSGATPSSWYTRYSKEKYDFSEYDCAIVCLGRNGFLKSEEDRMSYQNIIDMLKTDNEHMTIFILSLPPRCGGENKSDIAANVLIKEIADRNNLPYIDIYHNTYLNDKRYYSDGSVHFNNIGNLVLAQNILDNIEEYIRQNVFDFDIYSSKTLPDIIY